MTTVHVIILVTFILFIFLRHSFYSISILKIKHTKLSNSPSYPVFFHTIWNIFKGFFKYFSIFAFCPLIFNVNIPSSGSMTPTYRVSDFIYSSHCIYGISVENISIDSIRNFVRQYWQKPILSITKPQIGDVCVFRVDFSDMPFSKRIVARENDTVYISGPVLRINNIECPIKFLRSEEIIENGKKILLDIYERTLHNGIKHQIALPKNMIPTDIQGQKYFVVPKDHYFMLGDNYYNSDDSRSYLGFVHIDRIFAKLQFVIMRNPNFRLIFDIKSWLMTKFAMLVS